MGASSSLPGDVLDVWVIEDSPAFRRALNTLLEEEPTIRCSLAADSCEPAVDEVESGQCPHVVLMDIGLPGMGGIEGTRRIKSLSRRLHRQKYRPARWPSGRWRARW